MVCKRHEYAAAGERAWAQDAPAWGIWEVSESEVELLPKDLNGKRTIELGCGTSYVPSWFARMSKITNNLSYDIHR